MTSLGQTGTSRWKLLTLVVLAATLAWPAVAGAQGDSSEDEPAPVDATSEGTVTTDVPGGADTTDAGDEPTFTVFGSLNVQADGTRSPVEGVTITVFAEDGELIGEVTTDEAGTWSVEVTEPTSYLVQLDADTLPEGVRITANGVEERTVVLSNGRQRVGALFPLEEGEAGGETTSEGGRSETERFLQLLVEGIRFGLLLGLMSIGLSLIFGTTGLTNFAHAEMVTFGALAAYFFNVTMGLHVIPAFILAAVAGGLAGALLDSGIFRPLRRRGTSLIAQLVVTIGLSILLRYTYLYLFRGNRRSYEQYAVQGGIELGPINATPKDLWTIAICIFLLGAVGLLLQRTRTGRAMRAVSDNRDLASSSGINVERVILQVWVLGGGLAALSGALFGLSESIYWEMGFRVLLLIFAGVTLGGLGTAFGAAVGSLIIGIFVMVSTMVIPAELKNVGALAVLILVLVVRPQGILGRSERIGEGTDAMNWSDILSNAITAGVSLTAAWFALAAIGLNVHFGYTGLLNFGQIGFAAIAAYGVGVSVTYYGWSIWVGMGVGVLLAVLLALILGLPALRLRADYLAIVTIAAGEIIRLVGRSVALREYSGGSNGINGFSRQFYELSPFDAATEYRIGPVFFSSGRLLFVTLVTWCMVAVAVLVVWLLMRSPWGRILRAIRDDEDAARALGKSAYSYKIQSLVFGGVLGGLAGMMFAIGTATVQPDNFQPPQTFFIWAAMIIGGVGRVWGPVVGSMIFWALFSLTENILRPLAAQDYSVFGLFDFGTIMDGVQVGQVRFMLVGLGVVLLMVFRPQGLFGDRKEMALDDK